MTVTGLLYLYLYLYEGIYGNYPRGKVNPRKSKVRMTCRRPEASTRIFYLRSAADVIEAWLIVIGSSNGDEKVAEKVIF
jgi:hypothetical protein